MNQHRSNSASADTSRRSIRGAMISSMLLLAVIGVVLVLTLTRGDSAGHTGSIADHVGTGETNSSSKITGPGNSQSTPNCYPTRVAHWC